MSRFVSRDQRHACKCEDKDYYPNLSNSNTDEYKIFDDWFSNHGSLDATSNKFTEALHKDFNLIVSGRFEFGHPLLNEMDHSPFSQLYRTSFLMDIEATADE